MDKVTAPADIVLPDETSLLTTITNNINACTEKGLFATPPVTELTTKTKVVEKREEEKKPEGESPPEQIETM
jgi:hypothetical protein